MAPASRPAAVPIGVQTRGIVADDDREQAITAVTAVINRHRHIAQAARLRISGPAVADGPVLVQVNLRVCGAPARVQIGGRSALAAVAAAASRLDRQIRRLSVAWEPWPWPDPGRRTLGVPGQGFIARLKTPRLHLGMPCQAAAVLNAMDYDAWLFTDAETGEDAIIYRAGPTGLRLARQHTMRPPSMPVTLPLTINPRKIPVLTAAAAAHRLAECWLPFVFYTDRATGRGHLLYRRYDGDLGLISPPSQNG